MFTPATTGHSAATGSSTGLVPLLAQSFVEQSHLSTSDSPVRPDAAAITKKVMTPIPTRTPIFESPRRAPLAPTTPTKSPRRGPKRVSGTPKKKEDVFSWSDEMLAERYSFIEEVGFGNWGSVWKVKPKPAGPATPVQSVKLVHRSKHPTSSTRLRALWTEFKCVRVFDDKPHPNLIRFHAFVISPSYALCVMDYHRRLMPVALPETKCRSYFRQLLSAVAHLHAHGITHSDVKPSNILLSEDDRPILIDFGFAQHYEVTKPDAFLSSLSWGTPEYLSPERAKGAVHDERLSDVFALGVTMYEIVVGRTPFEETEDETFLNREALEIYYHRTLSGRFFGPSDLSPEFRNLIESMVHPSVKRRMPSCAAALRHAFFAPSPVASPPALPRRPPQPARIDTESAAPSASHRLATEAPRSEQAVSTPRKAAKAEAAGGQAFVIREDSSSDLPSTPPATSFSPRRLALVERTNTSPQQAPEPDTVLAARLAKIVKSPPPPSRIPVRKAEISTPLSKTAATTAFTPTTTNMHKRIASTPLAFPPKVPAPSRPRVVSQPLLSSRPDDHKPAPQRTHSIRRVPVPSADYFAGVATPVRAMKSEALQAGGGGARVRPAAADPTGSEQDEPEYETLMTTDPVEDNGDSGYVSRTHTYTVTRKSGRGGSEVFSGVFLSDLPKISRKSSRALSNGLKKLSGKPVQKPSSGASGDANRRRRASLSETTFEIIEAEKLDDREAHTLPLKFDQPAVSSATVARARLVSLTRRSEDLVRSAGGNDPFLIGPSAAKADSPSGAGVSTANSLSIEPVCPDRAPLVQTAPKPFTLATAGSRENLKHVLATETASSSTNQAGNGSGTVITSQSPSEISEFRPGHRRIPTAIRNTPSVILHESADDGDYSESDFSRADTPAFDSRVASPPPPPRVVAEARQLPIWISTEADEDDESDLDADVDEPTLRIETSPTRLARHLHDMSPKVVKPLSTSSPLGRPHRGGNPGNPRPPSTVSALPFTNLHQRSDSASTFNSLASSTAVPSPAEKGLRGLHKRSRSVLSFFSLLSPSPALDTSSSRTSSRASSARVTDTDGELGEDPTITLGPRGPAGPAASSKKEKKIGRVRKAVTRLFR